MGPCKRGALWNHIFLIYIIYLYGFTLVYFNLHCIQLQLMLNTYVRACTYTASKLHSELRKSLYIYMRSESFLRQELACETSEITMCLRIVSRERGEGRRGEGRRQKKE